VALNEMKNKKTAKTLKLVNFDVFYRKKWLPFGDAQRLSICVCGGI
jgi:predicted Zn-dependent protease